MLRSFFCFLGLLLLALSPVAFGTTFHFDTAPFTGVNVGAIPGRQIVGGEQFINFRPGVDTLEINSAAFGVGSHLNFINSPVGTLPSMTSGVNVIVLDTFENDNNPLTPFGASQAADLIASKLTTHGAGFFVYFNQSLNEPRFVYSTDLASTDADLQILARMINLFGDVGRNAMPTITGSDIQITATPEPSSISMLASFLLAAGSLASVRRLKRSQV